MNLKRELPVIGIVFLPFIYLAYIWNQLPQRVPIHWNIEGAVDRFGDKMVLLLIPISLPLLTYLLLLIVPRIASKKELNPLGNKPQMLKLLISTFMSVLALLIIYNSKNNSSANIAYMPSLIGALYIILGLFFKKIKRNRFMGIKTPWTLRSESVWNKTHKLAGKIWVAGGFLAILLGFILDKKLNITLFFVITGVIVFVPIIYSYIVFKGEKHEKSIEKS